MVPFISRKTDYLVWSLTPLLSEKRRSLALSSDLDPDLNFFYDSNESDYYTEDQFNDHFF